MDGTYPLSLCRNCSFPKRRLD
jgi:hypothetical protein